MGLFRRRSPRERFASDVLTAVRATGSMVEASYDAGTFAIRFSRAGEADKGWIYLENTFRECARANRGERAARIRTLVSAVVARRVTDLTWAEIAPKLRPVLRGQSFGQTGEPEARPLLLRPSLPYLAEFVVIDEPTSMAYVTRAHIEDWGAGEAEVFATARANLARLADGLSIQPAAGGGAVLRLVDTGDAYFTSMLMLDGFLAGLADTVGGRPVAFASDRDTLTIFADVPDVVVGMLPLIEKEYLDAPRALSPMAYTCDEGGSVVAYPPSEPGRLADLIHRAEVLLAASVYQGQKEGLDLRYERDGAGVFAGSLIVVERPGGTIFSVTVWADNCVALLPRADLICFQSDTESVLVPWPIVERVAGLRPEAGMRPERYPVTGWPEPSIRDQLWAEAFTL